MTVALRARESETRRSTKTVNAFALMDMLHAANQRVDHLWWRAFRDTKLGLTPRQYMLLSAVEELNGDSDERGRVSQTALTQRTGIDRSTIADIARRLVMRGLLVRQRTKQDARAYDVKLTPKGVNVLAKAKPIAERVAKQLTDKLSEQAQASLSRMLATVSEPDEGDE